MTILEDKERMVAPYRRETVFAVPSPANHQFQEPGYLAGLRDIWIFFRRRLGLISAVVLGCALLATVALLSITEIYTATSTLVLERKDVRPFETDAATQTLERDRSAAETEMDVLRSRQFAGRIVDRLDLMRDPEFNSYAAENVANTTAASGDIQVPTSDILHDRAISKLLSQISVSRTGESLAVNVAVSNWRPDIAAKIANTIAELYVESSLEFKQDVRLADKQRARTTGGAVGFLRERVAQPLLITLRAEEARLLRERAELASRFGKNHPKVVDEDSQITSVRRMIDDEVQRILQDLETEALKPSARIVSLAEVPTSPSFPKLHFFIPAAFAASGLLAVLLALILEATDTRIRNGDRTARILQIPNFGYVPRNGKRKAGFESQHSLTDQALRSVYLASRGPNPDKPFNVIMLAACLHDPASANIALGIAAAGATDGRNVVYADLDSPASKRTIVNPMLENVDHYLTNKTALSTLISEAPKVPGHVNVTNATTELGQLFRALNSKKLPDLLTALGRIGYDFIVLHASPVLAVGDATWLSSVVDGVILAISWGQTTEEQLIDAAAQLRLNRARLTGTVIDNVNPHSQARYGYGGPLKYYRQAERHLQSRA